MRTFATLLAGSAAGLLLAAGTAQAGVCSGEIMALQKQMEETPTMASNSANSGAAPLPAPDGATPQPGATLGAPPSTDAGGGETAHAAPSGSGEAGTTPGTEEMPDASGGTMVQNDSGTTPSPASTQPMDSDAAAASQLNTAAGTDATGTGATGTDAAAQALARARALDQAGDEAGCMNAIEEAKSQLDQ
jgi:hypothetical protein